MASSSRTFEIFAGVPAEAVAEGVILGTGPAGTAGASRILVHPDGALVPPVVYSRNPDRTTNLDTQVLPSMIATSLLTLSSTRVVRFERGIEDTICVETWLAGSGVASMTAVQFRLLYEVAANRPAFDPVAPVFVRWEPRDVSDRAYHVEILGLFVGSGRGSDAGFDVREVRDAGGIFNGGDFMNALDSLEPVQTGVLDLPVFLAMRVVSEAV